MSILAGLGVYFLLPQGRLSRPRVGFLFAAAALLAWMAVAGLRLSSAEPSKVYFLIFSSIALAAGVCVITHRKPVYSALYFVVVVLAVAALLVLQHAEFLAIALIIIYAGAIMVTYLFVIMLAQQSGVPLYDRRAREPFFAVLLGFVFMATVVVRTGDDSGINASVGPKIASLVQHPVESTTPSTHAAIAHDGNTAAMGAVLATKYVVVLEIGALLLLISMVGAIALSRKRLPREGHAVSSAPLGQVGKTVEPF